MTMKTKRKAISIIRTVTLGRVRIIRLVLIRTEPDPGTRNQSAVVQ